MPLYRFLKNSLVMRKGAARPSWREYSSLWVVMGALLLAYFYAPGFFHGYTLLLIVNQNAVVAAVSCCIALVMAVGHFDLSIGAAIAVTNTTCALLLYHKQSLLLAVAASLALGLLTGVINGYFVGMKKLSSFCVTLATQIGFEGLAFIIGGGGFIFRPTELKFLVQQHVWGLPVNVWILFLAAMVLQFLLSNTVYGRYLLAAGYREATARAAGIDVRKVIFIAYVIIGFMTGMIGIFYTARVGYGSSMPGVSYAYDGIICNLIGGNRISGGKSSVLRAAAGALVWGILQTYMGYVGISYYYQRIIKCMIIIFSISRDRKLQDKMKQIWN